MVAPSLFLLIYSKKLFAAYAFREAALRGFAIFIIYIAPGSIININ